MLGLGPWYYGIAQPAQSRADERHDRVDMVTRGMLGVTVACARCHDHKYDPFTAQDYYALAGVFASTAYKEYPLVSEDGGEGVEEAEGGKWMLPKRSSTSFLTSSPGAWRNVYASQIAAYMMATVDPARAAASMRKFGTMEDVSGQARRIPSILEPLVQGNRHSR